MQGPILILLFAIFMLFFLPQLAGKGLKAVFSEQKTHPVKLFFSWIAILMAAIYMSFLIYGFLFSNPP